MDGCKHVDRGEYSETWNMVKNGNRVAKLNMTPANRTCTRICIFAVQSRADLQDPPPPRVGIARTMCMYAGGGKGGRVQHPFVYSERGASPWCFLVDAIIEDLQG